VKVAGITVVDLRPVGGGDICESFRARTQDGAEVFAKTLREAPDGLFAAEARGLDSLRVRGGPPVPRVVAHNHDGIVLEWVAPGPATARGAEQAGRALAAMHSTVPDEPGFGNDEPAFVATVRQPSGRGDSWPQWWAECRLLPLLRQAVDGGVLGDADRGAVEALTRRIADLAGPAEPPARVHGDLWSGNLLWSASGAAWLVDAGAAHDGHRETDLAMLALFGAPSLDRLIAAYQEVRPLAAGWQQRTALHQVYPLLVHAVLFGGSYASRCGDAARGALRGAVIAGRHDAARCCQ
jgi:fructosamine-3-kinase